MWREFCVKLLTMEVSVRSTNLKRPACVDFPWLTHNLQKVYISEPDENIVIDSEGLCIRRSTL
jgi:hypothetical protein